MIKALFALTFCMTLSVSAAEVKTLPLTWKPTTDISKLAKPSLDAFTRVKWKIHPLKDKRIAPLEQIGVNVERAEPKPVITQSNVPGFVVQGFETVFRKVGMQVVDQGADFELTGELIEFRVDEKNTYKASLEVRWEMTKKGKKVWSGMVRGKNTRFGRSFKDDNYLESFSDVIINTAKNFFEKDEVLAVLGR